MNNRLSTVIGIAALSIAMVILALAAVATMIAGEQRRENLREMTAVGDRTLSFLSLHAVSEWESGQRDQLLRRMLEHVPNDVFAYFYVHDASGSPVVALADESLAEGGSPEVASRALVSETALRQDYTPEGASDRVYEFAQPVYENGRRDGTVRLGLRTLPPNLLTRESLTFLASIAFLMLATAIVGYYAISLSARALRSSSIENLSPDFADTASDRRSGADRRARGVLATVELLNQTVTALNERIESTSQENSKLVSQLGIYSFRQSQAYRVLDALDVCILILNKENHISHANRQALSLLKRNGNGVLDCKLSDLIEQKDVLDMVDDVESQSSAGGTRRLETGLESLAPDRLYEIVTSLVGGEGGNVAGKLLTIRDISRAKELEATQQDFMAQLSHELLTPVTTMKTYSEMLMLEEIDDKETLADFYNTINSEADRMATMIQNLFNLTKIEAGGLVAAHEMVKTDWLTEDCFPAVEAAAVDKNIEIRRQFPDKYPTVRGDKELLKIVLVNLLANAVKYTPPDGKVDFSLSEDNGHAVFEVTDTGCGISAEDIPHVFEKFYRSADRRVRDEGGSGLGLATAWNIVDLHHGTIEIESEIDKGSTFKVRLPTEKFSLEQH